jgi:hypothetical protein
MNDARYRRSEGTRKRRMCLTAAMTGMRQGDASEQILTARIARLASGDANPERFLRFVWELTKPIPGL